MTDPKKQQKAEEEQIVEDLTAEDLTVPEEQAEAVRGGDGIAYGSIHIEYKEQN